MKLKSIYEHMENATKKIPENANCKIIFRHSIRGKIDSGVGRKVKLTDEGVELARFFGRNLETEIGFVASSSCDRNIQTCEEILLGAKCKREIIIAPNELEGPQTKDKGLSDKVFEQYNFANNEIIYQMKKDCLPGFNSVEDATKIMVDFMFANGNKENSVDLFCTHDFQMAILYAGLFNFAETKDSIINNKWPMMLEGMIFWGNRNHFWCAWRGEVKEYNNF
jgi:hypothetical protein